MQFPPIVAQFPHFLHGGDYNPEQWLKWKDTIWKEDMRLAKLAGINSLSVGIFSWAMLEPAEGEYHFEWLDEVMAMLAENGIVAVLATPSGAKPAWMSKQYPEILRVNTFRQKMLHGDRHNHCLSSPVYREKIHAINTLLASRYKEHPALGVWHISNEYGGECHCPLCQEQFRNYLKKKYGALEALNEAWWTAFWSHTYTDWEQVESPSPLGEANLNGLRLDWRRFTTEQFVDFYRHESEPMRSLTPAVPCTTNLMGTYPGIDYFRLAEVLDVASFDSYPRWTGTEKDREVGCRTAFNYDLTRGLKGKPFMLMESCPSATNWQAVTKLRRPNVHELQSLQAVAHGADTVQYFQFRKSRGGPEQFHGAVVDHEGSENTRVFRDVAAVGKRLKTLDALVGSDTPSKVGIIFDWNVRWALDDAKGFLQDKTGYEQTVVDHYRAFWKMGTPVDIIDSTRSFDKYTLLVAPMLFLIREGVAQRIDQFVQNGGIFVATYLTGYVNESALTFLGGFPGPLKETLGLWFEEIDALFPEESNSIEWGGKSYRAFDLCELAHLCGAAALGTYQSDFYAGYPALTVNQRDKGKAYCIAARTGSDLLDDFYRSIVEEAHIKPALEYSLPQGVSAQIRSSDKKDFIFVMNFTDTIKTVNTTGIGSFSLSPFESRIIER
ncbi:MAG: beta-galactosidase [Spirochaetaceae bacterium]|jgi:beta-galactosidase|nr:beta-galactosidase [Spirochaetaceae bacterium]